jgi:hypothetical protein
MGKVVLSRVEVSGGEHTTVSPHVEYDYEVGGVRYRGDRIRAGDRYASRSGSKLAYAAIDRYPVGSDVTVYYNPGNPSESAVER